MDNKLISDYSDILSPHEVKEILKIGTNQVYSILKSGELRSFKLGKQYRIPKKCLIEYINKKTGA